MSLNNLLYVGPWKENHKYNIDDAFSHFVDYWRHFVCIKEHVSSQGNEPGMGENSNETWMEIVGKQKEWEEMILRIK